MSPAILTLADAIAIFDTRYPPAWAEEWDEVGLVAGDPAAPVRRVMFAVDPVAEVVAEAIEWGADLLVTHHPLLLRGVHSVAANTYKGAIIHQLIQGGCALFTAHTNADAANRGVADALAAKIGLTDRRPLVQTGVDGNGNAVGVGRIGQLAGAISLGEFAQQVAAAIPSVAQGVRVAGDLDAPVRTVAVVGGAGDSLFDEVRAAGVDIYVTADLRHHPASEFRERVEFDGAPAGFAKPDWARVGKPICHHLEWDNPAHVGSPYLVDLSHFASEWPWLSNAADDFTADAMAIGARVECRVSTIRTDPWNAIFR